MLRVDLRRLTDYRRDEEALQQFYIFCALLERGAPDWALARTAALLERQPALVLPLPYLLGRRGRLKQLLLKHCAQYEGRLTAALTAGARLSLRQVSLAELEAVDGVKCHTARFFLLHSRPDVEAVVLDAVMLDWLAAQGRDDAIAGAKLATPPTNRKVYRRTERDAVATLRRHFPRLTLAQADTAVRCLQACRNVLAS